MEILFAIIAAAAVLIVVIAAPGVIAQRRNDIFMRRLHEFATAGAAVGLTYTTLAEWAREVEESYAAHYRYLLGKQLAAQVVDPRHRIVYVGSGD